MIITPGQRYDCTQLQALLDAIRVPHFGKGRPHKRPDHLIVDRGCSYPLCRRMLKARGIPHTIPEKRIGPIVVPKNRSVLFPSIKEQYARRKHRLKQWRGIATRYEKRAVYFHAAITLVPFLVK